MDFHESTIVHQRTRILFAAAILTSIFVGCDTSLQPGDQLYALRNPSRNWTIPEKPLPVPTEHAKLAVDQSRVEFGVVERNLPNVKEVTLSNSGKAPLAIQRRDATTSVTVSPTELIRILPGQSRTLQICWTPVVSGNTNQQLQFQTNDPQRPLLTLDISGEAYNCVSVDPPMLMAARVRPDRPTETRVLISSEAWDEFEVRDLSTDLDGLAWQMEPADSSQLLALRAKSGWVLRATLPAGLEPGELSDHSVIAHAVPTDADHNGIWQPRRLEIPIRAKVMRRLAVYGGGVDNKGTIQLGVQPRGVTHTRKLTVKVHDESPELELLEIRIQPAFLQVDFQPYRGESATGNLYRLEVKIPANAPDHIARGEQLGKIQLKFDHPRIEELNLGIDFVLHGRTTDWNLRDVIN